MAEYFWMAVCIGFLTPMVIDAAWFSINPIFDYFRRKEGK